MSMSIQLSFTPLRPLILPSNPPCSAIRLPIRCPTFLAREKARTKKYCETRGFGVPGFGTPHLGQKLCLTLPFRVPGEPKRHGRAENTQARPPRGKAPGTPPPNQDGPRDGHPARPGGAAPRPPRTGGHGAGPVSPRRGHLCVDTGGGTPRRPGGGHGGGGGDGELALGQLFNGISERVVLYMDLVSWDE